MPIADPNTLPPQGPEDALTKNLIGQVAGALGITPVQAKRLIVAAHNQGGTWVEAATAVVRAKFGGAGAGTDATTDTNGAGGASGGGSAGPAGPSPEQIANAKASYANMLKAWGIPVTPGMNRFITQAVTSGMGSSTFLQALRQTKAYAQAFPGLVKNNGTLRMTESQYISGYQSAKDFAASVGRNFSRQAYGLAIKNNNSPSELKSKIQAIDTLKTNRDTFAQFNEYLIAKGLADPKKGVTKGEMLQFIMRQGPVAWEREWNTASQAAELAKLAIDVGRPKTGSDISYKELQKLQKELPQGEQPNYAVLADALKALPASKLYGYGLTKKNLLTLAYGGKGADAIALTATRALAQYRAAVTEMPATPQLAQSQTGTQQLTGRRVVQATE